MQLVQQEQEKFHPARRVSIKPADILTCLAKEHFFTDSRGGKRPVQVLQNQFSDA